MQTQSKHAYNTHDHWIHFAVFEWLHKPSGTLCALAPLPQPQLQLVAAATKPNAAAMRSSITQCTVKACRAISCQPSHLLPFHCTSVLR
jgi:hypothetical protein